MERLYNREEWKKPLRTARNRCILHVPRNEWIYLYMAGHGSRKRPTQNNAKDWSHLAWELPAETPYWRKGEGRIEVTGRRGRRGKQLLGDIKWKEKILELERLSSRSHCVGNWLWKVLWTGRKRDYVINEHRAAPAVHNGTPLCFIVWHVCYHPLWHSTLSIVAVPYKHSI
jgi:hypothetical protein